MLLVLPEKPIGMQPQSIAIKAQQAIRFMFAPLTTSVAGF